jgi:UDP-glucose 4-epimerase
VNVLVIGGAGFVGSHLVDRLLAEGHAVDVVDDLSAGTLANLADARHVARRADAELKIHHLDARSDDLAALVGLRRPDVIVHLALIPRHDRSDVAVASGFGAAVTMVDAARRHGIGKVVVVLPASALFGRPPAKDLPVKEGALEPRGVRGVVARAIVDLLSETRERDAVEFTALASASIYGPRQRPGSGVVATFADAAWSGTAPVFRGGGRQTRDLLFVDDAVDACVRALDHGGGLVVNLGTARQTSIADLWRLVAEHVGGPRPLPTPVLSGEPEDLMRFAVSPVRARIHLGWSPWTELEAGLSRLGPVS